MALIIVGATGLLLLYMLYALARPLYWKFYAEVIHRYEPDPALALIKEIEQEAGTCKQQSQPAAAPAYPQHITALWWVLQLPSESCLLVCSACSGQSLAAGGSLPRKVDPTASPQQQLTGGKHVDLSKLTLEQLERLKEKAREKQWEDEWWKLYQKKESERREKVAASYRHKEKTTISMYNITLTRCGRAVCQC